MQRYSASQGYTSYGDDRHSGSIHVFQATPHSLPTQQMIPPSPNGVGAAGGAPIALSSHASAPVNPHQSFDTFDDIEWQWTSPTSVEHRHQHSHSQTQQQAPQPHGQHGQYAYGFSSPGNHNSFGPGSPQSPHQHAGVYSGSDGAGAFGPLSAPNSAVGSYSTSPPAISPLSSMPPPHESGYGPRSQQNQQSSILSSSLPVSMDYRLPNGSQFTFPSSPSPAHHQHPHNQTQAFGVSTIGAPNEWPSPTNTGQNDSLQSNGARPIRRRPIRKSESDTSYSSPAATAARLHLQRSMSGGGAHELNMNGNRAEGGNFIFMPSPSSPLSSPPPTLPMFLPNSGTAGAHKHSRSRSSGGSSSPGGGMLLSTSPTSPEIARAARGIATSTLTATRSSEEKSPNATEGMECRIYSDGEDEDGEAAKKRRKRDSRDGKEGVKVGNDSMSSTTAGGVTAMLLNATSTVLCSHQHEAPKKSLLQPPKASPSTWQIYFTDQLQLYRSRHPDQKLNVAQAAKELAQEYKRLSAAEREPYKRRAQAAKAERDRQMMAWEKTLTPDDVRQENAFRAAQRRDGRSRRANMKDPNAPKKPLSAYFMFLQRIRASPEMVREVFGEEVGTTKQSVLAAAKWRSMSDEEKKPFLARAEQEKLIYEEKRRQYEESFVDPDDPDSTYYTQSTLTSDGFTLSGHFVGIEQLSLDDTFTSNAKLPNIKAFQVLSEDTGGSSPGKVEMTDEDVREALETTMLQRVPT